VKTFFRFAAAVAVAFLTSRADAATLVYDEPVIQLAQGGSVAIGATLYAPGLKTDGTGRIIDGTYGIMSDIYGPLFALNIGYPRENWIDGPSGFALQFSLSNPNPLANLDLTGTSSVHLILGTLTATPLFSLTLDGKTPEGTYVTDIGLYRVSTAGPCGFGFSGICMVFDSGRRSAPGFANAGDLTVVVTSETPLPGSLMLFGSGLVAVAAAAKARRLRQRNRRGRGVA
jgi:hypothetical protein